MRAHTISVGDVLRLKPNNPYGMGPLWLIVREIREKPGYKTPWIMCDEGAFRPSDFAGHAPLE